MWGEVCEWRERAGKGSRRRESWVVLREGGAGAHFSGGSCAEQHEGEAHWITQARMHRPSFSPLTHGGAHGGRWGKGERELEQQRDSSVRGGSHSCTNALQSVARRQQAARRRRRRVSKGGLQTQHALRVTNRKKIIERKGETPQTHTHPRKTRQRYQHTNTEGDRPKYNGANASTHQRRQ
jgi:hypothetical protein